MVELRIVGVRDIVAGRDGRVVIAAIFGKKRYVDELLGWIRLRTASGKMWEVLRVLL